MINGNRPYYFVGVCCSLSHIQTAECLTHPYTQSIHWQPQSSQSDKISHRMRDCVQMPSLECIYVCIFRLAQHDNCVQQCRNYNNSLFYAQGPDAVLCSHRKNHIQIHVDIPNVLGVCIQSTGPFFRRYTRTMLEEQYT